MTAEPMTDEELIAVEDAWSDVQALPEAEHHIEWTLERGYLGARVVCKGDDNSPCRVYCSASCETTPCSHMPEWGKSCGIEPWFDDGPAEFYDGPHTEPRNGPIELIWIGDGYDWKYPEATA